MAGGCLMIIRMIRMKRALDRLHRAKINAHRASQGLPPLQTWSERVAEAICDGCRETCGRTFCPCCVFDPEISHGLPECCREHCCCTCLEAGTYPNLVLKNILGFILGMFLTLVWFFVMTYQLEFDAYISTITCMVLGTVLTIGLAFFNNVRCLTFLALPQVFSSKGRALLLAIAFVLTLNGPVQNFRHNMHVMSEATTCGQEMSYNTTKQIVGDAMAPVVDVLDNIRRALTGLMNFTEQLRLAFMVVRNLYIEITEAIDNAFGWLGNMVNVCNDKMGGPYKKCKNAFDTAKRKCKKKLGAMGFLCKIASAFKFVCNVARIGELLCFITKKIKEIIVSSIEMHLIGAIRDVYSMFYFNVSLHYHYQLTFNQSKTYAEIRDDIHNEIEDKFSFVKKIQFLGQWGVVWMLMWLIVRAVWYRKRYLSRDRYDNFYVGHAIQRVEDRRDRLNKETILPLSWRERLKFIRPMSLMMTAVEIVKLVSGVLVILATAIHIAFYMACDYGLYWLLDMVRMHGALKVTTNAASHTKMHVQGNGILADMYRALITQFDPAGKGVSEFDTTQCLPNPAPPDLETYETIGWYLLTCFILTLTESYGLRLRHIIMDVFYPKRAKERAIWLYNHILKTRGGFLKFLRRKLRKQFQTETERKKDEQGVISTIAARSRILGKIFRLFGFKEKHCLACGLGGKPDDHENFQHCANYGCDAIYCQDCFTDINNMCTVCMNPVDYGDLSDFSEERDSSEDEVENLGKEAVILGNAGLAEEEQIFGNEYADGYGHNDYYPPNYPNAPYEEEEDYYNQDGMDENMYPEDYPLMDAQNDDEHGHTIDMSPSYYKQHEISPSFHSPDVQENYEYSPEWDASPNGYNEYQQYPTDGDDLHTGEIADPGYYNEIGQYPGVYENVPEEHPYNIDYIDHGVGYDTAQENHGGH